MWFVRQILKLARHYPRDFTLITRTAVLAPAALQSTRAIETRSLPTSLAATHRGFAFYVAFPKSSIPNRGVFYVADSKGSIQSRLQAGAIAA